MAEKLLNIATITEYNDILGVETLHPLVSVIDLSKSKSIRHMRHTFSFYALFLKDVECGDLIYGRQKYDYQKGTIVCLAPGQVIGIEDNGEVFQPKGWAICFDPDIIRGTALAKRISEYSYFSYNVNE
ncbi:MAG: AraC family transcriptional regulator, partial [Muribaculaceae bacterium]|nr:AraC family transcriptional regulator [Muribaculaceae bacterium]